MIKDYIEALKKQRELRAKQRNCNHNWQQDPKCDLVDICTKCGEERA